MIENVVAKSDKRLGMGYLLQTLEGEEIAKSTIIVV
jgi:hypothetical protein